MKSQQLFIAATDTGVGKTLVAAHLLRFLLAQEIKAGYQKWVATGGGDRDTLPPDLLAVIEVAGEKTMAGGLDLHVPYRFSLPASPHLAAEKEGSIIDAAVLTVWFQKALERYDVLLIEGVGGVLVPLRRDLLLADFVAALAIPVLVVARSGLGTINHTLLTLEALRTRGVAVVGIVFTDSSPHEDSVIVRDNVKTIATLTQTPVLGRLPWADSETQADEAFFREVGQSIFQRLGL